MLFRQICALTHFNPELISIPEHIITISPGGFKGIYMFGVCTYIHENYKLSKYVFSGASAGAWNALFMTYQAHPGDLYKLNRKLIDDDEINKMKNIQDMEYWLKSKILTLYDPTKFNLSKLYIGTTTLHGNDVKTTIFHDFNCLEEAIDCCIASSHIPFVTGGLIRRFRSYMTFDGGFSQNPYLTNTNQNTTLHISPGMWKCNNKICVLKPGSLIDTTLFSRHKYNFKELFVLGYNDAKQNKKLLDILHHS
jgi:hypothetical protein